MALEHAHANDVLHRDVKPSNLLIDEKGHLWITDFGLARISGGLDLTQTGEALGTPRYMSPEQALGRRAPLDGRTDIYSLGATLYEILTLASPFPGDDRLDLCAGSPQEEPIPPRKIDPRIPVDLETIVLKAMAKAPADRYATAAELAADLGRFLDDRPILARRPSLLDRAGKWMRRHRKLMAVAGATGLLLAVCSGGGRVPVHGLASPPRRGTSRPRSPAPTAMPTSPTATDGWLTGIFTPRSFAWPARRSRTDSSNVLRISCTTSRESGRGRSA